MNITFKIMCIVVIVSMLVPMTVGLKCETDNPAALDTKIYLAIYKIDNDGHLVYNLTCVIGDIANETMLIYFYGSSPFTRLNQVDVHTELFIEHLSEGESGLFKTKDQVFRVLPIIRRPFIPFYKGEMELIFLGHIIKSHIYKWWTFIQQDDYYSGPYP